jgi:hypothetical protein
MMNGGGETRSQVSAWTVDTYAVHNEALRIAEEKFQKERDRRYTEVALEREKALRIKEKADSEALQLARDIQKYKDEKANELREQINSERGLYATKLDVSAAVEKLEERIHPILTYVNNQQGKQAVVDPQMTQMIQELRTLTQVRAGTEGEQKGLSQAGALIIAVAVILFGIIGATASVIAFLKPS